MREKEAGESWSLLVLNLGIYRYMQCSVEKVEMEKIDCTEAECW